MQGATTRQRKRQKQSRKLPSLELSKNHSIISSLLFHTGLGLSPSSRRALRILSGIDPRYSTNH